MTEPYSGITVFMHVWSMTHINTAAYEHQ